MATPWGIGEEFVRRPEGDSNKTAQGDALGSETKQIAKALKEA